MYMQKTSSTAETDNFHKHQYISQKAKKVT